MSETALRAYLNSIEKYYKAGIATEHTYRGTLQELLESIGTGTATGITATNEPKRVKCGAPDYVIEHDTLTIGYVEAKDVGSVLDKIEKDEQLGRYRRALDNLILTDYLEFRWYVKGEKQMTARLATPRSDKRLPWDKDGAKQVEQLLHTFLGHSAEPIRKPQELAQRMARLAHMIRDIIVEAFEKREASNNLRDLYSAFREVLLPQLSGPEFADMFAQTLAYGLFAARYNHSGKKPFRREDAAKEIPRTNPFLRKLFGTIAGPDLDDEPFVGFVDELVQILAVTDMDTVLADFGKRTRQEDPILHFYETFIVQYDPKVRELRGVYYTPEPVVSYIVRSVDHLLHTAFDCPDGIADTSTTSYTTTDEQGKTVTVTSPRVLLLDPACGTGTFMYHIIGHIRETFRQTGNAGMWPGYVREHLLPRIFGFELLMAPYAMAHLKIGMQLAAIDLPKAERETWSYDFKTDERLGLFLTNTLEEAVKRSGVLFGRYISDEANEAAKVKQSYPVMVVIGNPPYSGHSANKGQWIADLLHGKDALTGKAIGNYFEVDGKPLGERNPKWLNDDYVKFIRFAQWRIEQTGYGILAFITNHGYLDNPTFRGMRQSLMQSFDEIYVLDLHGNSKKKERSPDGTKDENVFDIQQGVAIGLFVRRPGKAGSSRQATVYHSHVWGSREVYEKVGEGQRLVGGKYHWLAENDVNTTEWKKLNPQSPFYIFTSQNGDLSLEYDKGIRIVDLIPLNGVGLTTARDHTVIDYEEDPLLHRASLFRDSKESDKDLCNSLDIPMKLGWDIQQARKLIQGEYNLKQHIKPILYRPFDKRVIFYHDSLVWRTVKRVMSNMLNGRNLALATTRSIEIGRGWEHIFCTRSITQHHSVSLKEVNYLFPLYLYPQPNKNTLFDTSQPSDAPGGRRPNLSPSFITDFSNRLKMQFIADGKGDLQHTFGPEDIFSYMYAVFHSPMYRTRYAEFLKIDFPRLPLTSNADLFRELCGRGARLVELHLMEKVGNISTRYPGKGNNVVEKIDYTQPAEHPEQCRVWINKTQYFEGVPPEVWEFHVGGYQVCHKWLKDRKGRELSYADIQHYQRIVAALAETITLMEQVDEAIEEGGGWPMG